jgi:hypothetical protein
MPPAYTAGEWQYGRYIAESAYGTILTGALSWMGELIDWQDTSNHKVNPVVHSGSRSFGQIEAGPYECGFRARYHAKVGAWKPYWMVYGCGATGALTDHLGSFTSLFDMYNGTDHAYLAFNGCKVDKARIIAPGPGKFLEFETDVLAQWHFPSDADKALTGLQAVTMGADPTPPSTAPLSWAGNAQINIAGDGAADIYLQSWNLTVDQHLEREFGIKTGADAAKYPLTVAMHEGLRDIIFEAELVAQNQTYANAKKNNSLITALTLGVDTDTITLANGRLMRDDFPAYKQGINRESIKIRFPTLTVA